MSVKIRIRRGTDTQWAARTTPLLSGEFGYDTTNKIVKIGDGTTLWSSLPTIGTGEVPPNVALISDVLNALTDANEYTDEAVASLSNTLPETYVPQSDVGNVDGVAPLDGDSLIPDQYIPSTIARDSEIPSLTGYATETYVNTAVSNIVDSAPETLNTLNELAAALGDDANYASTISTALGNKLDSTTAASTYLTQTNASSTYAPIASPTFTGTVGGITKSMVNLGNVDNTSDANKPVSTATQTALDLKLNIADPAVDYYITNSGSGAYIVNGVSNGTIYFEKGKKYRIHVNASGHPFWIQTSSGAYNSGNVYSTGITNNGTQSGHILVELASNAPQLYYACQYHSSMAGSIVTGTRSATYKALADLSNVDNTSDANKPVSTATQTALNLKANIASPTFTGTVSGITKSMVGLGNVDNTSDANKPVSTAQAAADTAVANTAASDATTKANAAQAAAIASSNTYTDGKVSDLINGAPGALDTLNEIAEALGDDANYASTITNALALKAPLASPTFTGTVSGITATMVGLGNVDNTPDANKPVSTATQAALDLKVNTSDPAVDYYITNSGSGAYLVNGVLNGLINFEKGKRYRIYVNATGHPFWIQTVSGGYSSGNIYNTGITGNGTQLGSIVVELPQAAPAGLYYACQFHSSMAGAISVKDAGVQTTTNAQAGSYTVSIIDSDKLIEMSGGGTLTITDSSSFPTGFTVNVLQTGSSQVTIAGNGFTVNGTPGLKLRAQWSSATLVKRGLNSWVAMGDLSV